MASLTQTKTNKKNLWCLVTGRLNGQRAYWNRTDDIGVGGWSIAIPIWNQHAISKRITLTIIIRCVCALLEVFRYNWISIIIIIIYNTYVQYYRECTESTLNRCMLHMVHFSWKVHSAKWTVRTRTHAYRDSMWNAHTHKHAHARVQAYNKHFVYMFPWGCYTDTSRKPTELKYYTRVCVCSLINECGCLPMSVWVRAFDGKSRANIPRVVVPQCVSAWKTSGCNLYIRVGHAHRILCMWMSGMGRCCCCCNRCPLRSCDTLGGQ